MSDSASLKGLGESPQSPVSTSSPTEHIRHVSNIIPTAPNQSGLTKSSQADPIPTEYTPELLEIDNDAVDENSSLSMPPSSTVSLSESIFNYIEENGRTYHAYNQGKYPAPNDEAEQERLDLQHHIFLVTLEKKLHMAPLGDSPQNVLDIGTGTGIWAIEFAEKYPSAKVIGSDLSPIQPNFVPSNCAFEISDAEDTWIYSNKFDYIHARTVIMWCRDPHKVIASAYENLAPGGWFEIQDPGLPLLSIDGTLENTSIEQWQTSLIEGMKELGVNLAVEAADYVRWMEEAGFVDITEHHFTWPISPWARGRKLKLLGMWAQQDFLDGCAAISMAALTRGLGWSKNMAEVLLAAARNDVRNLDIHAYSPISVVCGRKPL